MESLAPEEIKNIHKKFQNAGYQLYLVGGSVRNILLFKDSALKKIKDWDMTTNATPEQILTLFPDAFYDNTFGTVGIPAANLDNPEHKNIIEITTFRSESEYRDRRHPEKVVWGKTIEEDLARRDFTMNAIAMKLTGDIPSINTEKLIDPFNGKKDIDNRIIRAVGNANERFKEDALRLLRVIRFATQLGFAIEEKTWKAILEDAALLSAISSERVRNEFLKILASDSPYEGIMLLKSANLLLHILPELLEGIGISQERPGRHHTTDVFTHNVLSLKECPSKDPIVRFATLVHDIGKPQVKSQDRDGLVIFYNHEIVGAKIAYEICKRLNFSKKDREKIVKLIRWHMFSVDEKMSDAGVRRFIRRIGVENVKDMIDLRIGDRLGGGTQTAKSWRLKLFKKRIEEQLQPAPFSINDLAIDGYDVMKELHVKPGKKVGEILQKLFEEVDEDLSKNTKEYLLKRIKSLL